MTFLLRNTIHQSKPITVVHIKKQCLEALLRTSSLKFEAKIEGEKAAYHWVLNPGHLACAD